MNTRHAPILLIGAMLATVAAGCISAGGPALAWVDERQTIKLPVDDARTMSAKTRNGHVHVGAGAGSADPIVVAVTKKCGAITREEAQTCLDAIEIVTEREGTVQQIGWKWKGPRKPGWSESVAFDVTLPASLGVEAESHNGEIRLDGIAGECNVTTYNGGAEVRSTGAALRVETYNGRIEVTSSARQVTLSSHNGAVQAELNAEGEVTGSVQTYNGSVDLALAQHAAARLWCVAHNGVIHSEKPLAEAHKSQQALTGRIGDATGELRVETHNGSITIR